MKDQKQMTLASKTLLAEINQIHIMPRELILKIYGNFIGNLNRMVATPTLRQLVVYKLQESIYGGLDPQIHHSLIELNTKFESQPIPNISGTRYIREWRGKTYEVIKRADGLFEYNNRIFKSLSSIAQEITGTHWNGKLFFGRLKK